MYIRCFLCWFMPFATATTAIRWFCAEMPENRFHPDRGKSFDKTLMANFLSKVAGVVCGAKYNLHQSFGNLWYDCFTQAPKIAPFEEWFC